MPSNTLDDYPKSYSKILLAIPATGESLEFTLRSAPAAQQERLRFYNFLKFLRRNPDIAAHFSGRERSVRIALKGNTLAFSLRGAPRESELDLALEDTTLAEVPLPGEDVPIEAPNPESAPDSNSPVNPLEIFERAMREKENGGAS